MAVCEKVRAAFVVLNEKGLHTRPTAELVKCTSKFRSKITLTFEDLTVNGKSLLGILMLAAPRGARIFIEAEGEDAEEAVENLIELASEKFNAGA